ncbi:DMT family transporter [Maridesulfovibrio bastinii]|uniref:DMT family transporter n=1 Tax=Maridesulfovibrio bastinii TaxID=47157 RepID=UPI00040C9DDC|nr:DMT family transporter [Maridesulfovibrio bastinii]
MPLQESKYIAVFALIIAVSLWASTFVVLKMALVVFDPNVIIFGRMFVASICFLFLIPRFKKTPIRRQDIKWLLLMAFCEPCMYFVFESHAMIYTSASQAGMIVAMLPLMMAVSAKFLLGEDVRPMTIFGFCIAVAGGVWLSIGAGSTESSPDPMLGNFLEFLAMCCAVGYMTILKKMTSRYSSVLITAIQAFAGTIFYLPLLALPSTKFPENFELMPTLSIVYLGIFITIGAYGLYNFGMSRLPANQTTAFVNLIPVITIFLGWLILGETFSIQEFMAAGLVMLGVFISQDRGRKKRNPPTSEKNQDLMNTGSSGSLTPSIKAASPSSLDTASSPSEPTSTL